MTSSVKGVLRHYNKGAMSEEPLYKAVNISLIER